MTAPRRTRAKAGRPPSADRRRLGVYVRLTADELAAIDGALTPGSSRAAFLRGAALARADRIRDALAAAARGAR